MGASKSSVENQSARTIKDDASVTEKMAGATHEAVDRAAERAGKAEQRIRKTAADSSESVRDQFESAKRDLEVVSGKVERYVQSNPVTAAGIAFAAGVLLSSLLRR